MASRLVSDTPRTAHSLPREVDIEANCSIGHSLSRLLGYSIVVPKISFCSNL